MGLYKLIWAPFFWVFILGLGLRPNQLLGYAKFSIWVQTEIFVMRMHAMDICFASNPNVVA